jgi:GntR family transcriptional regulator/MocR family aminotransferase
MNVLINIDASLPKPIYRQIVEELKNAILDGYLKAGEKLPSTRDLGKALGISRFTVMRSYEDLVSAGYVKIATGSGAYVSKDLALPAEVTSYAPPQETVSEEKQASTKSLSRFSLQAAKAAQFEPSANQWHAQLNHGAPSFDLLPLSRWKEVLYAATRDIQTESASIHHDPFGRMELRESIADYLSRARRVRCSADRVVVFPAWQNALDFILRLLVDPGDGCALESPGLPDMYRAFLAAGATVHPIALDNGGMNARGLGSIESPLKLICTNPSRNQPTGVIMTAARRQEILAQAEQHDAYIIENDLEHEFRYGQKAVPSMQGMDTQDRVIYIGSFAQVLSPLTRISYVVLPEHLVSVGNQVKTLLERDYSPIDQVALARLIQDGHFERQIKRTTEIYAERRASLMHALTSKFGDNITIISAGSGTSLTVCFHHGLSNKQLIEAATKNDVSLVSIGRYYPLESNKNEFLMGFGHLTPERIASSISALAADLSTTFVAPSNAAVLSLGM